MANGRIGFKGVETCQFGVTDTVTVTQGNPAVLDLATGLLVAPASGAGRKMVGFSDNTVLGASASAPFTQARVTTGPVVWSNVTVVGSGASGVLVDADVGKAVYVTGTSACTVLPPAAGTGVFAGYLQRIETYGTSSDGTGDVAFPGAFGAGQRPQPDVIRIDKALALIADGDTGGKVTMKRGGVITGFRASVSNPATTAAKASTLTLKIGSTAVTGGSLALTSANMTPAAAVVNASAVTAANRFAAGDTITLVAASTTTFIEGNIILEVDVLYDPL